MINVGLRAHDLGRFHPAELARAVHAYGFPHIQLALQKALVGYSDFPELRSATARAIRSDLSRHSVNVSVLGCYINPVHPDPDLRERGLRWFEDHLRICRDIGSDIVATETGSLNADNSWNNGNSDKACMDMFIEAIARLVRVAERSGCRLGLEGVAGKHVINRLGDMKHVLREINSPALGVVYDPVNFLPVDMAGTANEFIRESLEMFGSSVIAVHLKDYALRDGRKDGSLPTGYGLLDIEFLVSELEARYPGIPVLLENNSAQTLPLTIERLKPYIDTLIAIPAGSEKT